MEAYLIAIAIGILIYMLLAFGLSLHYGFTGLINFGHVGFFSPSAPTPRPCCRSRACRYPCPWQRRRPSRRWRPIRWA